MTLPDDRKPTRNRDIAESTAATYSPMPDASGHEPAIGDDMLHERGTTELDIWQAADVLNCEPSGVLRLIEENKILPRMVDGRHHLPTRDVMRYKALNQIRLWAVLDQLAAEAQEEDRREADRKAAGRGHP